MSNMEIKLMRSEGDVLRLQVLGKITRDGWSAGRDPLVELYGQDIYKNIVLLNMSQSIYMDSTGVEWLLTAHKRFEKDGGKLILHSGTAVTQQLLKMMRMDLVLNMAADEEAARKSVEEAQQDDPATQ